MLSVIIAIANTIDGSISTSISAIISISISSASGSASASASAGAKAKAKETSQAFFFPASLLIGSALWAGTGHGQHCLRHAIGHRRYPLARLCHRTQFCWVSFNYSVRRLLAKGIFLLFADDAPSQFSTWLRFRAAMYAEIIDISSTLNSAFWDLQPQLPRTQRIYHKLHVPWINFNLPSNFRRVLFSSCAKPHLYPSLNFVN